MTQAPFDADTANDRNNSVDRSLEATLAREEAATNAALEAEAQQQAQQQQQQEDNAEAGPGAEPQPGATLENEAVHQITSADVKRQEKCDEKIAMMIPDPDQFVQSALKGIQTAIQNMTAKLDKFLQSLQSYVDAVGVAGNGLIHRIIEDFGGQMVQGTVVGAADIHAGAVPDGLQPFENLDIGGIISVGRGRGNKQIGHISRVFRKGSHGYCCARRIGTQPFPVLPYLAVW